MKSQISLDTSNKTELKQVLEESLQGNKKVDYKLETGKNNLVISVETETLSQLRGCTDTVFRLSTLTQKIFQKY